MQVSILIFVGGLLVTFHATEITACSTGWDSYGDSCYFNSKRLQLHWFAAKSFCEEIGGNLVVPENELEDIFVAGMARYAGHLCTWLGVADVVSEGHWVQYPSLKPFDFARWAPNEPSNWKEIEHCGALWQKASFKWNDVPCFQTCGFICKK